MYTILMSVLSTIYHLKRKCPKCKKEQVVPPSKGREHVRCKFCGAAIPPYKSL